MAKAVLDKGVAGEQITTSQPIAGSQDAAIARDLELMDELEAFVQSLPDLRAEAGLATLPDDVVALSYEEREVSLL